MSIADRLRRLDDASLPVAARRWRRWRRRRDRSAGVMAVATSVRATTVAQPALAGSIAVVLVAGILFAVVGRGPDADTSAPPVVPVIPTQPPTPLATIGPAPGSSVPVYLTRAKQDLEHYSQIAAQRPTYAVVDLRRYLTVTRALAVVADVHVVTAYVRVPSALATPPRRLELSTSSDLPTQMRSIATLAKSAAKTYAGQLRQLHPRTDADRQLQHQYRLQRRTAILEGHEFAHPATCRCVFAFVVNAGLEQLNTLANDAQVRVVDPAPPVVPLTGLTVLPLQPQAVSVVPRDGLPSA